MTKPQRGTVYLVDGRAVLVKPEDGKEFSLSELQTAVGGYIESVIPLNKRTKLWVNEEGLLQDVVFLNPHTQEIVDLSRYPSRFFLVGNALSTYRVNKGEEHDEGRCLIKEIVWPS